MAPSLQNTFNTGARFILGLFIHRSLVAGIMSLILPSEKGKPNSLSSSMDLRVTRCVTGGGESHWAVVKSCQERESSIWVLWVS
jgi:hypothetical protein